MHVVAIYNNKGGVGKSTLTVGLAEFLTSNRQKRVLVIDLDAQASCSCSLLGRPLLIEATQGRSIVELAGEVARTRRVIGRPADFFTPRPATGARGSALERIDVLVPDKVGMLELEEGLDPKRDATLLRDLLKPALRDLFDFVLIDMPGNIDRRSTLIVAALVMSDFVLVPIEPNQIALTALPDTFDLIHYARDLGGAGFPVVVGMVLNKTDRRTQQFRSKMPEILKAANLGELPPVFENLLPDTPKLATATDETLGFRTLKDRFDTYYDHVRKVARELEQRCEGHEPRPEAEPGRFGRRILDILYRVAQGKCEVRPRSKVLFNPLPTGPGPSPTPATRMPHSGSAPSARPRPAPRSRRATS
jgi:chromosome partitioning protein